MAFKGTLKEFKVPDILQLISFQKKTGILTFTNEDRFITLIFEDGMIVGVDAFPKKLDMRMGSVLVKQDYISEEMLQRALDIQKRTNQKIGEILVGMGMIGRDTIQTSLRTQAIEIVLSLFKWKQGEYNLKVMEALDEGMKIISPIPTDGLIMEGVQMLDEWPEIKRLIPDDAMIFEPLQVHVKNIIVVNEYDEIPEVEKEDQIYLTETESNLLKYVNGINTVQDLVEMGIITEYKVYKGLYNLIRKSIIKAKAPSDSIILEDEEELEAHRLVTESKINFVFKVVIGLLLVILAVSFFKPMHLLPFKSENILIKQALYDTIYQKENKSTSSH